MKIYIGGSYRQNGGTVGGLYSNQNIYVFYEQSNEKNKAIYLKQTFHHEFSSILIQAYGFPAFDWLKLNNPDFDYLINPRKIHEYLRSISVYEASEAQLKQGLVSSYGKSNAENDINTYVEMIFTEPKKMSKLINTYPIIHAKYDMIKAFYLSISSGFEPVFSAIK
ncbi:MAG: hypothetical protein COB04_13240 [Gammaproteobacteria bacterium]|nr:MAG: hypothetical protein COB04_13240 [Gammaproteobacteria bacterium]